MYTLCATYADAVLAVRELARESTLILDCEGRDLGMPDGTLSIIAIGNATASRVFLFDILALADKRHYAMATLLSLLRRREITKVVWDGRSDFLEIAETFGVLMGGVLDLQLVEVAQRARAKLKKTSGWRQAHTTEYFKRIQPHLNADPSALDGIFRLYGLDHCANLYQVLDGKGGKDHAVVALHKQNGSEIWMHRPLPEALLQYSARDVEIIARLYARLREKGGYLSNPDELKAMSARYMRVYPTRELKAMHVPLHLSRFLPLDVLEEPPPDAPRYRCVRCERMLSLPCFACTAQQRSTTSTFRDGDSVDSAVTEDSAAYAPGFGDVQLRFTMCRLCNLLALRNAETITGWWVVIRGQEL
ncbi:ribonuclease H-like domain-containing protein [Earliella scabrosa]|nr:ribonuclease H-like domain-containing protein [Earliella scabrosa]